MARCVRLGGALHVCVNTSHRFPSARNPHPPEFTKGTTVALVRPKPELAKNELLTSGQGEGDFERPTHLPKADSGLAGNKYIFNALSLKQLQLAS